MASRRLGSADVNRAPYDGGVTLPGVVIPALWTAAALVWSAGCQVSSASSVPAIATIRVEGETFRVKLTTEEQVEAARKAQTGDPARIPNGRIVAGPDVNTGWTWHLEDVEFVEVTIALCDGRPSDVEKAGVEFGGGRFCPWGATVVGVEP